MSELTIIEYLTLDGVAQAPGHATEDTDAGFPHGGWAGPHLPDHRQYGTPTYQTAAAFLFGRRTYELWLAHWPGVTDPDDHIATALNARPKYVASTTLTEATWPGTTIWSDRIPERVIDLKTRLDGDIVVAGSTNLARTLIGHDLVDSYQLWLHPVTVGPGKRLLDATSGRQELRLVTTVTTRTGLVILTYERSRS